MPALTLSQRKEGSNVVKNVEQKANRKQMQPQYSKAKELFQLPRTHCEHSVSADDQQQIQDQINSPQQIQMSKP